MAVADELVPAENLVRRTRGRTESMKRLSKRTLAAGKRDDPPAINAAAPRPATYGECVMEGLGTAANPCPYVSCKYHLAVDVGAWGEGDSGSIKVNFPDREVWELPQTCALEAADRGGMVLDEVGALLNLTRERIRQLETRALAKLKALGDGAIGTLLEHMAGDEPRAAHGLGADVDEP